MPPAPKPERRALCALLHALVAMTGVGLSGRERKVCEPEPQSLASRDPPPPRRAGATSSSRPPAKPRATEATLRPVSSSAAS